MKPPMLGAGDVHVWWARPEALATAEALDRARALLSRDEQAQLDRFVHEASWREYIAAHALVQTMLSRYVGAPPHAWQFRTNEWGRPELVEPNGLRFNLSHTAGLVACAFARDRDVGVDVESLARRPTTPDLADYFFAPAEAAALRALPESERPERFLEYWTLKEAYIKARGKGLAIPLDQFWFRFDADALLFTVLDGDDAARWQFARFRPSAGHVLALCVERGERDAAITIRETSPIGD